MTSSSLTYIYTQYKHKTVIDYISLILEDLKVLGICMNKAKHNSYLLNSKLVKKGYIINIYKFVQKNEIKYRTQFNVRL